MSYVDWEIHGPELATCTCDWGCPCQFNAVPTHGDCRGAVVGRIDRGHFGDLTLDGLHWAALFAWPGALHEGNGQGLIVVDESADEAQREALLTIVSGGESEPGATVFSVLASTLTKVHDPIFAPIDLEIDVGSCTGRARIPNVIEARAEPIRNPVTGAEHRAKLVLPDGFEYGQAEFGSGMTRADGPIRLDYQGTHAHLAMMHLGPRGQIR